ncbi:MAG: hypothetical protein IT204_05905 [Fimbriimonadaceae bacterium]|nr:hypothetical protein [Fimbriimonadaceae bacterium]
MRTSRLVVALVLLAVAAVVRPAPRPVPAGAALSPVAFGGLNGLLVDLLWLRASRQQDEADYFELQQTAAAMAALQPQLDGLAEFQAWNLSYNIANQFADPAEQYHWILAGLRLLSDGLAAAPHSAGLATALAATISQRIGDPENLAATPWQLAWAQEWTWILGGPRPQFELLAAAGASTRFEPDEQRAGQAAARLGLRLERDCWQLDGPLAQPSAATRRLLAQRDCETGLAKLRARARLARLQQVWRYDLRRLQRVDHQYGPLDWRSTEAHAVYWALTARELAGGAGRQPQAERLLYQALWSAFQRGRIVTRPGCTAFERTPLGPLLPVVERELATLRAALPADDGLRAAAANLAADGVFVLWLDGDQAAAAARFEALPPEQRQGGWEDLLVSTAGLAPDSGAPEVNDFLRLVYQRLWRLQALDDLPGAQGWEQVARLTRRWASRRRLALEPVSDLAAAALEPALQGIDPDRAELLRQAAAARLELLRLEERRP